MNTQTAESTPTITVAEMFSEFLENLAIENMETLSSRYGELTAALNKKFRDTESKTDHSLQIGSFGRKTGINGISDLDMLYIMPKGKWEKYRDGKQLNLLRDVKDAILARYPNTDIRVDRLVVTVTYTDFHVEIQPVFEQDNGSFQYPDTKGEGSWRTTKPREEMTAISELNVDKNKNVKRLCKMARAWKNKHGLQISGLLIDTLVYNFLSSTAEYDSRSYLYYDWLSRDFFGYLAELPDQEYYAAPGSGQRVRVKKKFQRKARKAHRLCKEAIEAEESKGVNKKWGKVYGRAFPAAKAEVEESRVAKAAVTWRDTEEFIEDDYPVDIRYTLSIDCNVAQNGFREHRLRDMLERHFPLLANKTLTFAITDINVPTPYQIKWKVLNRGEIAERRDCIRGQIVDDGGRQEKNESTNFKGPHLVECYAIKDGVVVAKDRIRVPIAASA
jgi:hypothetical protein